MDDFVTDTHAILYYLSNDSRLGQQARAIFERCDDRQARMYVPAICFVEMIYLQEKGKIPSGTMVPIVNICEDPDTSFDVVPLTLPIARAMQHIPRDVVPDMPDRIIAAVALALSRPLLTRDSDIRKCELVQSVW